MTNREELRQFVLSSRRVRWLGRGRGRQVMDAIAADMDAEGRFRNNPETRARIRARIGDTGAFPWILLIQIVMKLVEWWLSRRKAEIEIDGLVHLLSKEK